VPADGPPSEPGSGQVAIVPAVLPDPLDEYPIHQSPLSMARVATSDRNFYDRNYFNAFDQDGENLLISGGGYYPNVGVKDAFLSLRRGDRQWTVRFSDAMDSRDIVPRVGGWRLEIPQPLQKVRLICEHESLSADLTWEGSFPSILEEPHLMLNSLQRPVLDAQRFAQLGSWSGSISVEGETIEVDPSRWLGSRDRSWGIRPTGDPEPAGRESDKPSEGFWWLYVPFRFETFALIVIVQEQPDGYRTLNDARCVFADGRVEQLGWPRVEIEYRSGTRHPEKAKLHLTTPTGRPLLVEIEPMTFQALHVGGGYGADPEWTHGQWKGPGWVNFTTYDYTDPQIAGRVPWGVIDHSARAVCDGETGLGLFEHTSIGRHDPTGFADFMSVAP
jgi:hypothetical protein